MYARTPAGGSMRGDRRAVAAALVLAAAAGAASGSVDCRELVAHPVDAGPIRSPQDVHTVIAKHLVGKSVVEIGTRNGDGMSCMAQRASNATAVEISKPYCVKLRQRASALRQATGHAFQVVCQDYRTAPGLDADVFTWWQETPHLHNPVALLQLRQLQMSGQVRAGAEAIMVFDKGWAEDMVDLDALNQLGWPSWNATLEHVDEFAACMSSTMRRKGHCSRVKNGTYYVAGMPLSRVLSKCPDHFAGTRTSRRWRSLCADAGSAKAHSMGAS